MFTLTIEDSNTQIADQFAFDHGSYVIGRLDECDIVLPSSSVSRKHARIFIENDRCYIEDLGSANGVIVDGQRVIQRRDLGTASQIRIGDFYMYVEFKGTGQHSRQSVLNTLFITDSSDHHKLVRINDAFAGEEFSLSEIENTIGRTDENFILLSDPSISRRHAKIIRAADSYTVIDQNSSNGTRLNGKALNAARSLKAGDIVEFGDIEFVFVDGAAQLNLGDYAHRKSSAKNAMAVGTVALILVGLALGAGVVYLFFAFQSPGGALATRNSGEVAAAGSVEARAAAAFQAGNAHLRRHDWAGAITLFTEVLALSPGHKQAQQLRAQAYTEQKAADFLRKGEELSAQGRHQQARAALVKIPANTVAHQRSESILAHVEKTLAFNLKNEASRTMNREDSSDAEMAEAHEKLVRSLSLTPGDQDALALIRKLEATLKKNDIDFEPYTP
jgi:pSer/pThr/pTyr-binding forkhead associated (FHA) protein